MYWFQHFYTSHPYILIYHITTVTDYVVTTDGQYHTRCLSPLYTAGMLHCAINIYIVTNYYVCSWSRYIHKHHEEHKINWRMKPWWWVFCTHINTLDSEFRSLCFHSLKPQWNACYNYIPCIHNEELTATNKSNTCTYLSL